MNISKLLHVTILVQDLPKARGFYEQVLGLSVCKSRPQMSFDGVWYDFGAQQLHLMQLPNPEAGLQRPANGGRDRHIAFAVDDLDALVNILQGSGVRYNLSQTGRRALFCRDPDENALEFIEVHQQGTVC
jgi:catechol 2,3-dioxygenase-like lactoylglutathione lyase family enzyme